MHLISRRTFAAMAVPLHRAPLDSVLRDGIARRRVPAVCAAVATSRLTLYSGAFGIRDSASRTPVTADSIFAIASMTKAITTTAALQLVERGKLSLDEPVAKHLAAFENLEILDSFDATGKPVMRKPNKPVTLRMLLTHTAGFGYENWDERLVRFNSTVAQKSAVPPLMFEPGTEWEYGTSVDWAGRLVEAVTGSNLEAYFQQLVLQPLGMRDTSYILPPAKFARKVSAWQRQPSGALEETPYIQPGAPTSFNGGGGLYSTAADYVRFMQMVLRHGGPVLKRSSVALMRANQTPGISAGKMKTARPMTTSDVDFHPRETDGFTFGFLRNETAYEGARSAGSLAWAGIENTFYWIDPKEDLCAVLLMQFRPFCDSEAMGMLHDFERAVYAAVRR